MDTTSSGSVVDLETVAGETIGEGHLLTPRAVVARGSTLSRIPATTDRCRARMSTAPDQSAANVVDDVTVKELSGFTLIAFHLASSVQAPLLPLDALGDDADVETLFRHLDDHLGRSGGDHGSVESATGDQDAGNGTHRSSDGSTVPSDDDEDTVHPHWGVICKLFGGIFCFDPHPGDPPPVVDS